MKEMVYSEEKRRANAPKEILDEGEYLGFKYIILNLHSHPTAYVFIRDEENDLYGLDYDEISEICRERLNGEYLDVHGGLTFSDDHLNNILVWSDKYKCDTLQTITGGWIIGWDYAHMGDYCSLYSMPNEKKWSTQEIQNEVKQVINQLDDCLKYRSLDCTKNEFIEKFLEEYADWCGYIGEAYSISDDIDALEFSWKLKVNGVSTELLDDYEYNLVHKYIKASMGEIMELVDEYIHPYDPWTEHRADWYGLR